MRRFRFAPLIRWSSAASLAALLTCAQAAELGDAMVSSHTGQPLVADIELTALAGAATPLTVRMANADVYRGANIAMHPALAGLNMSIMRRDGRQFLHLTSSKAVDAEYVHLFVELIEGSKRNVRAVTLWLTPDPAAPSRLQAQSVAPLPAMPSAAPPEPLEPDQDPALAVRHTAASRRAPAPLRSPVLPAPAPAPLAQRSDAAGRDASAAEKPRPARVLTLPSAAAACHSPQSSEEQTKSCAAVDYKNGLLSAQIVELEEKVKQLQLGMEGKGEPAAVKKPEAEPAASAAHAGSAAPPVPVAAHAGPAAPPAPPVRPAGKHADSFPWLLVGGIGALLLLIGGATWFALSRRKGKTVETAAADSVAWYARLAGRFKRKPKAAPAAPAAPPDA